MPSTLTKPVPNLANDAEHAAVVFLNQWLGNDWTDEDRDDVEVFEGDAEAFLRTFSDAPDTDEFWTELKEALEQEYIVEIPGTDDKVYTIVNAEEFLSDDPFDGEETDAEEAFNDDEFDAEEDEYEDSQDSPSDPLTLTPTVVVLGVAGLAAYVWYQSRKQAATQAKVSPPVSDAAT